ncbi:unnamed protein product, partial [Callosobruchus maculatus]
MGWLRDPIWQSCSLLVLVIVLSHAKGLVGKTSMFIPIVSTVSNCVSQLRKPKSIQPSYGNYVVLTIDSPVP